MNPVFERAGLTVFERGWLSSNNVLFHRRADREAVLVDSGYHTHSEQTVSLVRSVLGQRGLDRIVNTHLHSDHCGGNHALQLAFDCKVDVPRGEADVVDTWDEARLSFDLTGQACPRFHRTGCVEEGVDIELGGRQWQVLAAPGHDPVEVILYQRELRLLISADALWQNGFGVVFPELEGIDAFSEARGTLDRIAELDVAWVIPGHGAPFEDVKESLCRAYRRLDGIAADPDRHAKHAARVLLKFHLMDVKQQSTAALLTWMNETRLLRIIHARYFNRRDLNLWFEELISDLCSNGAIRQDIDTVSDVT